MTARGTWNVAFTLTGSMGPPAPWTWEQLFPEDDIGTAWVAATGRLRFGRALIQGVR